MVIFSFLQHWAYFHVRDLGIKSFSCSKMPRSSQPWCQILLSVRFSMVMFIKQDLKASRICWSHKLLLKLKSYIYFSIIFQVFLKAMAETGQVKLYGETPTLTETALYRARRHLYKEERYCRLLCSQHSSDMPRNESGVFVLHPKCKTYKKYYKQ